MITRILVPTDFSEVANNALTYALTLASTCNASIDVLHVKQAPLSDPLFPMETYQMYVDAMNAAEVEGVEKLKQTILANASVPYAIHSVMGFVSDQILAFASEHDTDLVVMGTTGASGLTEILVGSNTASLIGKCEIPVLVVPAGYKYNGVSQVLYSTDYNEPEFPAISRLMYFVELFNAKLTILHVKTEFDNYFNAENNFFNKNKDHISFDYELINVKSNDVMSTINSYLEDYQPELIVLAKHNRSFFDKIFHRSLSKQMAYHTKIPLLVLHK
ncbi:MAG: universal stress protein [Bacteroidetes bacterium]|nr:MAG: universal stress protein [Bacteroidota bacterium]